jgi:heparosan-N-sulfate-glucuronate 5-epimerase
MLKKIVFISGHKPTSRYLAQNLIFTSTIIIILLLSNHYITNDNGFQSAYSATAGSINNDSKTNINTGSNMSTSKIKTNTILDNSSIPMVVYGGSIGPQRNPLTVAHYALSYYNNYKGGNQSQLQPFINNVNWLVNNAETHGNYSIFTYKFPSPPYVSKPGWHSALAQSQALQPLIKAYEVTGDKKYLNTAKMLLNALFVDVKNGGVTYKTPHDGWWYEEFARGTGTNTTNATAREPRILNGMMYVLVDSYDYYNYSKDPNAKFLFDQGVIALKKNLPSYDYRNVYSYYDLHPRKLAPLFYHKIHVDLLSKLFNITKELPFKIYHDKWYNMDLVPKCIIMKQPC